MGLRETLAQAGAAAFDAIDDVKESAWYYAKGSTVYDASAGVASSTSTNSLVSMVFVGYSENQVDNVNVMNGDMQGLVLQAVVSTTPNLNDYVHRVEAGASVRYDILNIEQDPAGVLWKFQLRKP